MIFFHLVSATMTGLCYCVHYSDFGSIVLVLRRTCIFVILAECSSCLPGACIVDILARYFRTFVDFVILGFRGFV